MDIIKRYLIAGIQEEIAEIIKLHGVNFIYFNRPVVDSKFGKIDRVNKWAPFRQDEMHPVGYSLLCGKTLLEMWKKIKKNKLYYYHFKNGDMKRKKLNG